MPKMKVKAQGAKLARKKSARKKATKKTVAKVRTSIKRARKTK
jgi:hypothetical protein|tara:strand:- start:558 stop:686 length:129 start_codon:yes stop_codon:yes gene_type:complete